MKKTVMGFRNQKIELRKLFAYSIVMGISINIIANSLGKLFNLSPCVNIIIWIGIALAIVIIAQIIELYRQNSTFSFDCLFITDESEKNDLVSIPDYAIAEDMKRYFSAAFSENPAYRTIWEESGLDKLKRPHITNKTNDSKKLVLEMIEYCVLVRFSMFIGDYYNSRNIEKKTIRCSGNDIPDVLLNNRFMKLFTEEPKNRAPFCNSPEMGVYMIDENDKESKDKGTLVYMIGGNGEIYKRFDLMIPKGSKVSRKDDNCIEVDTKLFTLRYRFVFDGVSTYVEHLFNKFYLHKPSDLKLHDWKFKIKVDVKYKMSALIKLWDWKYYNWLDEYIEKLSDYCDVKQFYKRIGWDEAKTVLRILSTPKSLPNED